MSKDWMETLEEQILANASRADHAVHDFVQHQHNAHWHPASTAPCNQELEIQVAEDGRDILIPFPCLHTNTGEWINVDLGTRIEIQPTKWRLWQHSLSPQPHHSPLKGKATPPLASRTWRSPSRQPRAKNR